MSEKKSLLGLQSQGVLLTEAPVSIFVSAGPDHGHVHAAVPGS